MWEMVAFSRGRHEGCSVLCHFRQLGQVKRAGVCVCVCVCARRILLVTHEKEPRLTVVHTLQENTFLFSVIESWELSAETDDIELFFVGVRQGCLLT